MNCSMLTGPGDAKTRIKHLADGDGFFLNLELLRQPFIGRTQGPHFGGFSRVCRQRSLGRPLLLVEQFGPDVKGAGGRLGRTAFTGQAQGFGTEGRVIARPFGRRGFFHGFGKLTPNSLLVHPTTTLYQGVGPLGLKNCPRGPAAGRVAYCASTAAPGLRALTAVSIGGREAWINGNDPDG